MSTILIAALSFVVGAITGAIALLAFAAWTTRDIEDIERRYRAAKDWKYGDELIEACCSYLIHWSDYLPSSLLRRALWRCVGW
jgi:hypothetical protein